MNGGPKASVREFRRPRAGDQGDEAPPPGPPALSSVPGLKAASRRSCTKSLRHIRPDTLTWRAVPRRTERTTQNERITVASALPLAEEALAGKASLRCHLDSVIQAERSPD